VVEPDETFAYRFTGASGASGRRASGTATIIDDDRRAPGLRIDIGDVRLLEGDSGRRTARLNVTQSAPRSTPTTVRYYVLPGDASAGIDFVASSGVLTIPAGATSTELAVPILGDVRQEPPEHFTVWLGDPSAGHVERAVGMGTILNDDGS
jgi:chitinase